MAVTARENFMFCYGRVFSLEEELENQREELSTGLLTLYLYSLTGFFPGLFENQIPLHVKECHNLVMIPIFLSPEDWKSML